MDALEKDEGGMVPKKQKLNQSKGNIILTDWKVLLLRTQSITFKSLEGNIILKDKAIKKASPKIFNRVLALVRNPINHIDIHKMISKLPKTLTQFKSKGEKQKIIL